jgi:hypothetical protein
MYVLQFSFVSFQATSAPYSCSSINETKSIEQGHPTCSLPGCVMRPVATFLNYVNTITITQ